jgi:AraC-like DNA-binding protein
LITVVDACRVPEADRADAVRETIAESMVRVEIDFPTEVAPVTARGVISKLGQVTVCSINSNALTVERTAALARDDMEPSILLGLQFAGSSLVVQGGREAAIRPRDLVIYDSTAPYTLVDSEGIRQHFFRIPHEALGLPRDAIRRVCATTLSPEHPVADVAATYLNRLASRPDLFTHASRESVSQPTVELVRALVATHLDSPALGRDALQATLCLRILEYARTHLGDPDLNAAQIAAEHHISLRHMYNVLAANEISLGVWIRKHRLEGCRDELARHAGSSLTIAAIAQRWGFTNLSSFGRSFRAAFGLSPRDWRNQALGGVDIPGGRPDSEPPAYG